MAMQRAEKSIRVNAPAEKVYQFWRNFENFPRFMEHVEEVHAIGGNDRLSHWKLKGPLGKTVEFDAELTQDEPGKQIGWNSRDGSDNSMETSGVVTFQEIDGVTEVHVLMQWYDTPGGAIGEAASRMLQDPEKMLEEDLQRFKDIAEGRVGSGTRR
jgi:uncharacterized membrane protein